MQQGSPLFLEPAIYCTLTGKIYYIRNFTLTKVKRFSDCVITAILDQPNCFMAWMIPVIISASLDKDLRKRGNVLVLERRGDVDVGAIWKIIYMHIGVATHKWNIYPTIGPSYACTG